MGYYPIFVQMERRAVLLVGGGKVAHEKIGKLVDAGARVTVVAPELIAEVRAFIDAGRATLIERGYGEGDVRGFELVMVATDDGALNRAVADEARAAGVWVNAADDVGNCDFILPSLVKRGTVTVAMSTAGTSPAMARWLREQMEQFLSEDVAALADLLADVRRLARERDRECAAGCDRTRPPPPLLCEQCPNRIPVDRWQEVIASVLPMIESGDEARAREQMIAALGVDRPLAARAV